MIRCDMCGMDVPAGAPGRCFLGHLLPGASAVVSPPSPAPAAEPLGHQQYVMPVIQPPAAEPAPTVSDSLPPAPLVAPAPLVSPAPLVAPVSPAPLVAPAASAPAMPMGLRPLGGAPQAQAPSAPPAAPEADLSLEAGPRMPSVAPTQTFAPVQGTAALDPALYAEPAPAPAPQEIFVVSSGGGERRRVSKPIVFALVALVAGVAAFGGYKLLGGSAEAANPRLARLPRTAVNAQGGLHRAFVVNQSSQYTLSLRMRTTLTGEGGGQTVNGSGEVGFTERILSANADGSTTLRYTFDRVSFKVDGGQSSGIAPGKSLTVVIAPDGSVKSVQGDTGGMDASFFEFLAPTLPKNPTVGARWKRKDTRSLSVGKPIVVSSNFELVKLDATSAVVRSESEVPFTFAGTARELGIPDLPPNATVEMRGRILGGGEQTLDRATGRTTSADGSGSVTMAIFVDGKQISRLAVSVEMTLRAGGQTSPAAA